MLYVVMILIFLLLGLKLYFSKNVHKERRSFNISNRHDQDEEDDDEEEDA